MPGAAKRASVGTIGAESSRSAGEVERFTGSHGIAPLALATIPAQKKGRSARRASSSRATDYRARGRRPAARATDGWPASANASARLFGPVEPQRVVDE